MVHGRPGHLSWRPGSMFRCSGERRSTRSRRHGRDGEPWRGASGAGLSARRSGREREYAYCTWNVLTRPSDPVAACGEGD